MKARFVFLPVVAVSVALFMFAWGVVIQAQTGKHLFLYGGADHKTVLGCLNCKASSTDSVCNPKGEYGGIYLDTIWNGGSVFGSTFSPSSPWNQMSVYPPIIEDKDGHSYGNFTINADNHRTTIPWLVKILHYYLQVGDDLGKTRNSLCGN